MDESKQGRGRKLAAFMLLACGLWLDSCAVNSPLITQAPPQPRLVSPSAPSPPPSTHVRREVASWYGPGFDGHLTSSGERFNQNAMTAASKTYPIGTWLRVTNPGNGRTVEVRVNDRGPFKRGRTMDLSKRAAQKLGITKAGVAHVVVTPAVPGTRHRAPSTPNGSSRANLRADR